jgi:DNA replication and repair protein RecF
VKLLRLKLENFRNHGSLELDFGEGADEKPTEPVTYLVGANASGKTNILEAIYLLALVKSFRTSTQSDLIMWDKDFCRVKGEFEMEEEKPAPNTDITKAHSLRPCVLEVFYGRPPQPQKSLKKNKVKVGAENFIGSCQIVFFHPEDLNMLYLGPDLRRRYLDILNLQISKNYYSALRKYKQALKQRNALIKAIKEGYAQKGDLAVWDEQLAENGTVLIRERAATVVYMNTHLQGVYRKIADSDDKVEVRYSCALGEQTAAPGGFPEPLGSSTDALEGKSHEEVKTLFLSALEYARKTDFQAEVTTVGPHRDDLSFFLNGRPLHVHASRGEYRSLLLSLKLLELEFFEARTGRKPILLLDDVFSELDPERQKMLMEAVSGCQTIITANHLDEHVLSRTHRGLGLDGIVEQAGDRRFQVLRSG